MEIKVTVIIPTYNRADVLGETLDSIQAQTMQNWECIIVDDGSTDHTEEVVNVFLRKDLRFKFIKRPNNRAKGGNVCRNIGLEHAKGEYIQFLDSDDLIYKNKFEEQLSALQDQEELTIATCKWAYFTSTVDEVRRKEVRPTYKSFNNPIGLLNVFATHGTFFPPHVFMVRKKLIEKIGNWKEELTINQDGEFFNRVILYCSKIIFVPTTEVYYRIGTGNKTNTWSNEERIKKLIYSWVLINKEIEQKTGVSDHSYVRRAITSIYSKIKDNYPVIIKENTAFFSKKYSKAALLYLRAVAKLEAMYGNLVRN